MSAHLGEVGEAQAHRRRALMVAQVRAARREAGVQLRGQAHALRLRVEHLNNSSPRSLLPRLIPLQVRLGVCSGRRRCGVQLERKRAMAVARAARCCSCSRPTATRTAGERGWGDPRARREREPTPSRCDTSVWCLCSAVSPPALVRACPVVARVASRLDERQARRVHLCTPPQAAQVDAAPSAAGGCSPAHTQGGFGPPAPHERGGAPLTGRRPLCRSRRPPADGQHRGHCHADR